MAEVIIENGKLVLKNFMTIKHCNNLLMDLQLEAKKNLLDDLNKIVNELMENPFSSIKIKIDNKELIPELIKILKPYKFTITYELFYGGGYYLIRLKKRGWFDFLCWNR